MKISENRGHNYQNNDYIIYGTLNEVANSAYLSGANAGSYARRNYIWRQNFEGKALLLMMLPGLTHLQVLGHQITTLYLERFKSFKTLITA